LFEFDYSENYILEDDFVKLSPLNIEHVEGLLDISNEWNVWTYFLEKGNGQENLTNYVLSTLNNRKLKKEFPFVIFDKVKNEYAGTTRLYDYLTDLKSIKLGHTWIGEKFRGTGLNMHCKYLLLEFAFEKLEVERIGFGAHIDNKRSIAAMKKIGCKEEGVLRNFIPSLDGKGRAHVILLSIIKDEWFNTIKNELQQKLTKA
tara:strand:+ start:799 stop:1404 length:606 start_codon:yes stop_codon:yes gene_type:complete